MLLSLFIRNLQQTPDVDIKEYLLHLRLVFKPRSYSYV